MTITQLQETKKGRFSVFADGEFLFSVHKDTFLLRPELAVGRQVTVETLEEIRLEDEALSCKEKALTLLEYSSHSAGRLAEKLRRHYPPETVEQVVQRLRELGLLDDDDYAERFARDISERKKFGILRIRQEMRQRGLTNEQIEYATSLLRSDPEEKMREIIARKYPLAYEDEKVRRRAFSALMRMGYPAAEVRRVLTVSEYD